MDYVPSMAAVAAAAQKSPHVDAATLATAKAGTPIEPTAIDLRSTYTLTPGAADAMLSLADMKTQAASAADTEVRYAHATYVAEAATAVATAPVVSSEPAKAISASNRNWNEDVRLDHIPTRKIGTDTVVQYDTPRVMAAWSMAFPDLPNRKFRGLTLADTTIKPETRKDSSNTDADPLEKDIYLLCNANNYRIFSATHPHTHINWIPVDNEEILSSWPNERDEKKAHESDVLARGPEETAGT